eukprot:TRINITY_DN15417_c0_g1_i1.p1 TRINITY_DN15417_c0_g1~~TRINITY_DN15417_c0_g1_i1.p1  ORF type:complete len:255 (-),score=7.89 TRINITY_DN15417_c0_g1_i1:34-798(-)
MIISSTLKWYILVIRQAKDFASPEDGNKGGMSRFEQIMRTLACLVQLDPIIIVYDHWALLNRVKDSKNFRRKIAEFQIEEVERIKSVVRSAQTYFESIPSTFITCFDVVQKPSKDIKTLVLISAFFSICTLIKEIAWEELKGQHYQEPWSWKYKLVWTVWLKSRISVLIFFWFATKSIGIWVFLPLSLICAAIIVRKTTKPEIEFWTKITFVLQAWSASAILPPLWSALKHFHDENTLYPVSYTHLTLPTIYSV